MRRGRRAPEIEVCRLALFALVRLREYDALARSRFDEQGTAGVVAGGPSRSRCSGSAIRARRRRCCTLVVDAAASTRAAFALRGLAAAEGRARRAASALALGARRHGRRPAAHRGRPRARPGRRRATRSQRCCDWPVDADDTPEPRASRRSPRSAPSATPRRSTRCSICSRDPSPAMRAAALAGRGAARSPTGFSWSSRRPTAIRDWSVRAALADVLATLPADRVDAGARRSGRRRRRARAGAGARRAGADRARPTSTDALFDALDGAGLRGARDGRATDRRTPAARGGVAAPRGGLHARPERRTPTRRALAALEALARYGGADGAATLRARARRSRVAGARARRGAPPAAWRRRCAAGRPARAAPVSRSSSSSPTGCCVPRTRRTRSSRPAAARSSSS